MTRAIFTKKAANFPKPLIEYYYFAGTSSSQILSYKWKQDKGPTVASVGSVDASTLVIDGAAPGTYQFRCVPMSAVSSVTNYNGHCEHLQREFQERLKIRIYVVF